MIKGYMLAYISPVYGLKMSQINADFEPNVRLVRSELGRLGECSEDIDEIIDGGNWEIKEIKLDK